MKNTIIAALLLVLSLAVPALAAQQDISQLSAVTASREALRTAINTQLSAVQANFDEVYAVINAGPVYVNASAPSDTRVVWIDTDQSNAIKVYVGGVWTVVGTTGSGDNLGSAAYTDVVALWPTCTGYLKSDGTCDTPSGSATYPSAAGVANWGGSAWGTSYTVGTAANNLVQLNGIGQLPAVPGTLLTSTFTGTLVGSATTLQGAIQTIGTELDGMVELLFDAGDFTQDNSTPGQVTVSITNPGIGGSTGSTDNAILRANGTGGSTAQASGVTIDDSDNVTTTGVLAGKMATVVNSDTASYNVTTAQARAGTLFLTTNTATTTYTLPAAEAGMTACFSMGQGNSQVLRIDTDGTDYIVKSTRARTGTAGDYYGATASATNKVCVAAYDATDWYVESEVGTWTEE